MDNKNIKTVKIAIKKKKQISKDKKDEIPKENIIVKFYYDDLIIEL